MRLKPLRCLTLLGAALWATCACVQAQTATAQISYVTNEEQVVSIPRDDSIPTQLHYAIYTFDSTPQEASALVAQLTAEGKATAPQPAQANTPAMLNLSFAWANATSWTPYVGAGAGQAVADEGRYVLIGEQASSALSAEGTEQVYTFVTGAIWEITPAWEMAFSYKQSATDKKLAEPFDTSSLSDGVEILAKESSLIELGVTYRF